MKNNRKKPVSTGKKNINQKKNLPPMKVIAGSIKGRKIICPDGVDPIRPMTAKVRTALFNILGDCSGKKMLDLFCGSGSISIEAYSRGMESSDMIEGDPAKREIILENIKHAGFNGGKLYISDVMTFCGSSQNTYDFIMTDPPYKWDKKEELLKLISERCLLTDNGILVIQLPKKYEISEEIGDLIRYDMRSYGLNTLMFYKRKK